MAEAPVDRCQLPPITSMNKEFPDLFLGGARNILVTCMLLVQKKAFPLGARDIIVPFRVCVELRSFSPRRVGHLCAR